MSGLDLRSFLVLTFAALIFPMRCSARLTSSTLIYLMRASIRLICLPRIYRSPLRMAPYSEKQILPTPGFLMPPWSAAQSKERQSQALGSTARSF
jgi:hypothetical protein